MSTPSTLPPTRLIPAAADRPGDDPIFALHAEATAMAARGVDVLNATLGALMDDSGKLAVMPSVFEAYRRVSPAQAASYAPISGPPRFLKAVREDLLGGTPMLEHSVAVATAGGTGACHHAIVNFLEPGQSLLTTSYYWAPYKILAEHARRGVSTFEMFASDGRLDVEALEERLDEHMSDQGRALVVLNTPCHNPTGFSIDAAEWDRLVEVLEAASERGPVALLLDLAYARFGGPSAFAWRGPVERLLGKVVVLCAWSASKAFAQYGSRVGALIAIEPEEGERRRIQNALGYSCRATWSNCNHLGMLAISELLEDEELRARSIADREALKSLLDARVSAFNGHAREYGLSFPRYEGGFFVAVFTPDARQTSDVTKAEGVFVVPLPGAVRVALCATPAGKVERLVRAVADGVRAAGGELDSSRHSD